MSVQQPWGFLIVNGFKKCENREIYPPQNAIGEYIALHVTKIAPTKRRHETYQIPTVQHYLRMIPETQLICHDNKALDEFFGKTMKSIVGVAKLQKAIDKRNMRPGETQELQRQYPFYDVGKQTNRKLLFADAHSFPSPITDVKGSLGITVIRDPQVLKEVRKSMADVEYAVRSLQQQQDKAQEPHEEEEKGVEISDEDDDEVIADLTGKIPRYVDCVCDSKSYFLSLLNTQRTNEEIWLYRSKSGL